MGITGKTSTKGLKGAYASGNLAKKISVICILEFDWVQPSAGRVFITNHFNKIFKIHNKIFDFGPFKSLVHQMDREVFLKEVQIQDK